MQTITSLLIWVLLQYAAGLAQLQAHWELSLLQFAALLLAPDGLVLLGLRTDWIYRLAATGFAFSLAFPEQHVAVFAALPYVLYIVFTIYGQIKYPLANRDLSAWLQLAALIYWLTGALWVIAYLIDFQPLGFNPVITALTGAHFHLAGFATTVLIRQMRVEQQNPATTWLSYGALAGMPLVAAGITMTHLGGSPLLEQISGVLFAGMALMVAAGQITFARQPSKSLKSRILFGIGGLCLFVGASLAMLYALRFAVPLSWVNIPNMKIWHGTLNTLGFAWCSLRAHRY